MFKPFLWWRKSSKTSYLLTSSL